MKQVGVIESVCQFIGEIEILIILKSSDSVLSYSISGGLSGNLLSGREMKKFFWSGEMQFIS